MENVFQILVVILTVILAPLEHGEMETVKLVILQIVPLAKMLTPVQPVWKVSDWIKQLETVFLVILDVSYARKVESVISVILENSRKSKLKVLELMMMRLQELVVLVIKIVNHVQVQNSLVLLAMQITQLQMELDASQKPL